jgi:hypothetical protein
MAIGIHVEVYLQFRPSAFFGRELITMRRRLARIVPTVVAAVATASALWAAPASADPITPSAWTISPGGSYTATTDLTELADVTAGLSFTCSTSGATPASQGTGTLQTSASGSPAVLGTIATLNFNNCTGPLGPVTATPNTLPTNISGVTFDPDTGQTVGYVGPVDVHVSMTGCEFDVVGNAPGLYDNATSQLRMGAAGATLPGGVAPLRPTNIEGCFGVIGTNDDLTYVGDYTVSPATTVTGT